MARPELKFGDKQFHRTDLEGMFKCNTFLIQVGDSKNLEPWTLASLSYNKCNTLSIISSRVAEAGCKFCRQA